MLCFNWLGYKFVFSYLEHKTDVKIEAQLDNENFNESELVSIKAAFSIPYSYLNKDKFERWRGEIEINGIQYKYVKRRFFNDSIEILCIPNIAATKIKDAKKDFDRYANNATNDQSKNDQGKVPAFKNLLGEYCQEVREWDDAIFAVKQTHYSSYALYSPQFKGDTPGQPPDQIS